MIPADATGETSRDDRAKNNVSQGQALLAAAEAAYPFRSPDGRYFVQLPTGQRRDVVPLRSKASRNSLVGSYRAAHHQLPAASVVAQAVGALEDQARLHDQTEPVFVRVGRDRNLHGGAADWDYYLDLANPSGQAVKMTPEGWSIVDRPPVHFYRPDGMLPLPTPLASGSIQLLRQYVNLSDVDFCLFIGWLAAAYRPVGPYPILVIHGEQGSAKSTLTRIARLLIDPHQMPLITGSQSFRDLMVTAHNGWLLALDNISRVSPRLADGLCGIATGGGHSGRRPFSGDLREDVSAERPTILNGIPDFIDRADLNDRCLSMTLAPILPRSRRGDAEFWRSFEADYPALLGGMLNAFTGGLYLLPSVQFAEPPRLADFACLGEAVNQAADSPAGMFLGGYAEDRQATTVNHLEESTLARALLDSASLGGLRNWTKSATEMIEELSHQVSSKERASSRWTHSPQIFSDELKRIAPLLRTRGISVTFHRTKHARLIKINADPSFDHSVGPHFTDGIALPA